MIGGVLPLFAFALRAWLSTLQHPPYFINNRPKKTKGRKSAPLFFKAFANDVTL
jgi:hypothetical protein